LNDNNKLTTLEIDKTSNKFNYKQLDLSTSEFLQVKEKNMRDIATNAATQIGKELKEAQDELSKHGYGCFEEWYTSLNFKTTTVYNLISRFKLIVSSKFEETKLIEDLPKSLVYAMAKPSADPELKQHVFDGDITTLKQYKELEKEKKQAEEKAKTLEESNKALEQSYNELSQELQEEKGKPGETVTVEVDKTDYTQRRKSCLRTIFNSLR
jgi:hypothetical protein